MIYVLENDKMSVKVESFGAELKSIYSKETDFEYLWKGNSEYWANSATILFPICGRLYNQKYTFNGKEYSMPAHGFARNLEFIVEEKTNTKIVLRIDSDDETKKMYPFNFTFKMIYTLEDKTVKNEFYVKNKDEEILPFSMGGHPGFSIPFENGLTLDDHYIEFNQSKERKQYELAPTFLLSGNLVDFNMIDNKKFNLTSELFSFDGIFLSDNGGEVSLKSDKSKKCVKISYDNTTAIGFWQKYTKNTPFICIEPWIGIPATEGILDDFSNKKGFVFIKKGENFSFKFDISITE